MKAQGEAGRSNTDLKYYKFLRRRPMSLVEDVAMQIMYSVLAFHCSNKTSETMPIFICRNPSLYDPGNNA